jgi:hypothetical protein
MFAGQRRSHVTLIYAELLDELQIRSILVGEPYQHT